MQARPWNKYQTRACGSLCTSRDRRHRGALGGTLLVDNGLGFPLLGQRSKNETGRGVSSQLRDGVLGGEKRRVGFELLNSLIRKHDNAGGGVRRCLLAPVDCQALGREGEHNPTL